MELDLYPVWVHVFWFELKGPVLLTARLPGPQQALTCRILERKTSARILATDGTGELVLDSDDRLLPTGSFLLLSDKHTAA